MILQGGQGDELLEEEAALSISLEEENNEDKDIDSTVISAWNQNKSIRFICNKRLMVDNDNEPTPHNISKE